MSALENTFASILRGLKIPFEREYKAIPDRRFRFDFYLPRKNVLVEIQGGVWIGGRHSGGVGQLKDMEKHNLAVTNGYTILYYGNKKQMADFETHYASLPQRIPIVGKI